LILFVVGKFDYLGWKGEGSHIMHSAPPALKLTPSQWATGWFFGIVALLFLAQSLLGGVLAHYRVEPGGFYGFDIARWLPYNLVRSWHLQLAIFWIATAWVGDGLFLASWVGGGEPKHQKTGVYALLGALVVVVVGSLAGEPISSPMEALNPRLFRRAVLRIMPAVQRQFRDGPWSARPAASPSSAALLHKDVAISPRRMERNTSI
jgi:nitric oxide reductase large subunit